MSNQLTIINQLDNILTKDDNLTLLYLLEQHTNGSFLIIQYINYQINSRKVQIYPKSSVKGRSRQQRDPG